MQVAFSWQGTDRHSFTSRLIKQREHIHSLLLNKISQWDEYNESNDYCRLYRVSHKKVTSDYIEIISFVVKHSYVVMPLRKSLHEWFMNGRSIYYSTSFCCLSSEANLNFQRCNNQRLTAQESFVWGGHSVYSVFNNTLVSLEENYHERAKRGLIFI